MKWTQDPLSSASASRCSSTWKKSGCRSGRLTKGLENGRKRKVIFAKTYKLVLAGRKTQTMRLAKEGDRLVKPTQGFPSGQINEIRVVDASGRCRWRVGGSYAVQPQRGHRAVSRIRVTYLRQVLDALAIDDKFARLEGFKSRKDFLSIWRELHGKKSQQRCWAIGFKKLEPDQISKRRTSMPRSRLDYNDKKVQAAVPPGKERI